MLTLVGAWPLPAQSVGLSGVIIDSAGGWPIADAEVRAADSLGVLVAAASANGLGRFRLRLPPGRYTLLARAVGYRPRQVEELELGPSGAAITVALARAPVELNPVVVTASRREEATLEAPASISVVPRERIAEDLAFTAVDHARDVAGLDFASKGLTQRTYAARGVRSVNSAALLVLTDFRYAAVPSLRYNVPYLFSTTGADLERIEVLRGPGSAVYGPDANRGVLHVVTRSPFQSRGLSVALTAGGRDVSGVAGRYAVTLGSRVALKVSGEYFRGDDWRGSDSAEVAARAAALAGGADSDTLRIGRRDPLNERHSADVRVDWRPDAVTEVVGSAGYARAGRNVELTQVGAYQVRDWDNAYAQGRLRHRRLFVNLTYGASDAGGTYSLRTGEAVVDRSRLYAGQVQHRADFGRHSLTYGVDARVTDPRTEGTVHGRNERDDLVSEVGAYLTSRTALASAVSLEAALRADRHNRLDNLSVSPRLGIVVRPAPGHAVRLTYNRAFETPVPTTLALDVRAGGLPGGLPYDVRAVAIPRGGYSFSRSCAGICMRSPFADAPGRYLPADATLVWQAVVAIMRQRGVDLGGVPPPTGSDVATDLRLLDPEAGRFAAVEAGDIRDVSPNRREVTSTVELGYKGRVGERVSIGVDVHRTRVGNMLNPLAPATPSAFLDQADLARYLAGYMSPAQAGQLAAAITQLPLGTVTPRETPYPTDILLMARSHGSYTFWGVDLELETRISGDLHAEGTYSWVSRTDFLRVRSPDDVAMGVPRHKGTVGLSYRYDRMGLRAEVRGRALSSFRVTSGVYRGRVAAYQVLDAELGYRLPFRRDLRLQVAAYNLLNDFHREYVGAPELGRLVLTRLRAEF